MKIAVLVKQVPSEQSVLSLDPQTLRLSRIGLDCVAGPQDLVAVECALVMSDKSEIETLVVSMGPNGVADSTKKALAMGIGSAVHITDDLLAGSDIWMTAKTLAAAISKLNVDFVFTGLETTDARSGVVPAMIAGLLDWNFQNAESEMEIDHLINLKQKSVVVISPTMNSPRLPNFKGIAAAKTKPVETWSLEDLELHDISPKVKLISVNSRNEKSSGEKINGSSSDLARQILSRIKEWSSELTSEVDEIESTEKIRVFSSEDKNQAAITAGKSGAGIISDVKRQISENQFVKEIFDGKVEVVVEALGECVVTRASAPNLQGIFIGVGGGLQDVKNLDLLVEKMSAKKVGTAVALEKGFITSEQLVGESGQAIKPNIYLTFGVSGAHHHMVGVKSARHTIAINKDPEAEIFNNAELAIVADADEILAELVKELSN